MRSLFLTSLKVTEYVNIVFAKYVWFLNNNNSVLKLKKLPYTAPV